MFTVLNLFVDDIDETVDELTAQGVAPERYDSIDTDDGGIYRAEGHSVAWLTDPAATSSPSGNNTDDFNRSRPTGAATLGTSDA